MRVNPAHNRFAMTSGIATIGLAIFFIASSFTEHPDRELRSRQVNLMIRQMGHRLLLQAGDATSRVLPVMETREGIFQLQFENEFSFSHDSLVAVSQGTLPVTSFPSGYTLTVHDSKKSDIVYGFQVNNASRGNVPCLGRTEPFGRYHIEIAFPKLYENLQPKETDDQGSMMSVLFTGMVVLVGATFLIGHLGKILKPGPVTTSIGKFVYDVKDQRLQLDDAVVSLTDKECKVLELLNNNFGELVARETLMQKVWIEEGVITGRSLDMFVSRLRKKLSGDPGLRISNVHGKGYKLEASPE